MGVRIEWTHAPVTGAEWVPPGEPAPDGQTPEYGGGALVIGALAIEGSPDEIRKLLRHAEAELPKS